VPAISDATSTPDTSARRVLVLDFDGTVCLGEGPVWAYANGVLDHLPADVAATVGAGLRAYLDGGPGAGDYTDGYGALAELAAPHVASTVLADAYTRSRFTLETGTAEIHAPDGLAELLVELDGVHRVVVTNAPSTGLDTALTRIGLSGLIDEVVASAGKPANSRVVLARLLAGAAPAQLMSVGDIWSNDIAPALDLGAATAFIDRLGRDARSAHVRAARIQQLYPAIRAWAAAPAAFAAAHEPEFQAAPSDS
jgi:FMN phosphatase YigB (HAD superfamily)